MKIQAAVARADVPGFRLETLTLESPRADEVRVRIVGTGLCHTDISVRENGAGWYPLPAVLGHEGAGIVEAVGADVQSVRPGQAVVLSFASCGGCPACHAETPTLCASMLTLNFGGGRPDGSTALRDDHGPIASHFFGQSSLASHVIVAARNCVVVDDDLPLPLLGPLGCGIMTGAGAVLHAFGAKAGDRLLILGGGSVGLSAVMAATIAGCASIIVVEPHAARRQLALELGATEVIDPAASPDLPGGMDHVLDTTGRTALIQKGLAALGRGGTLGLLAGSANEGPLAVDGNHLVSHGLRIIGIIEGNADPQTFIPELIAHHRAGRLPFQKLIRTYTLAQINTAIDDQHHGRVVKAVLIP
ncbi:NAD(P)-dependent alcohol dehydrogenase [Polymorphobacter sp.]|uniref:NAD(P)-dependent alcohol dehydrogenase n=1 Tax=Polymorphobacter sp. TaxID=1909290 RepID=UPI003F6FCE32